MPRRGDEVSFCQSCKHKGVRTRIKRGHTQCPACLEAGRDFPEGGGPLTPPAQAAARPNPAVSANRDANPGTTDAPAGLGPLRTRSPLSEAEEDRVVTELQGTLDAIRRGDPPATACRQEPTRPAPIAPPPRRGGQIECVKCGYLIEALDTHCERCGNAKPDQPGIGAPVPWQVYGVVRADSDRDVSNSAELIVTSPGLYIRDWMAGVSVWSLMAGKGAGCLGGLVGLVVGAAGAAVAGFELPWAYLPPLMFASLFGGGAYAAVCHFAGASGRKQQAARTREALMSQPGTQFVPLSEVTTRLWLDEGIVNADLHVLGLEAPLVLRLWRADAEKLVQLLATARKEPDLFLQPSPDDTAE